MTRPERVLSALTNLQAEGVLDEVRPATYRSVLLKVSGDPIPKGRPRTTKTGHTYTPKRTKEYEAEIGGEWLKLRPSSRVPFVGGVRVLIQVRERIHAADLDNYVKIALDALNGLAWADDKQVEVLHATIERGHPYPGLTIAIMARGPEGIQVTATEVRS